MTKDKLTKKIEKQQARIKEDARNYIGASVIGSDCLRQIWYEMREVIAEQVPTKTWRTWQIGKKLESLVLDWLDDAGITIGSLPRKELRSKIVPIFRGHLDAVWIGKGGVYKAIIEIKTAKDASFKVFVKKGVKVWNPQYYAQIQSYMGMSGIYSTYILVLNKDNSDISDELVLFDEEYYQKLEAKALMISTAVVAPPRVNGSPLWWQCKLCKFNKVCHK
jgi:hypothetical protein